MAKVLNKHILKALWQIFAACLLLPVVCGCSHDIMETGSALFEDLIPLCVKIPDNPLYKDNRFTRAEERAEGTISDLYFIAVETDSEGAYKSLTAFPLTSYDVLTTDNYSEYSVALYPGFYRFYVLANFNHYLSDSNDLPAAITDEETLHEFMLSFSLGKPLGPGNLPMAALPDEIYGEGQATENPGEAKLFEIKANGKNTITADLKYLCSKVRYTILFDNTSDGISSAFGANGFDLLKEAPDCPFVSNICAGTPLFPDRAAETPELLDGNEQKGWSIPLDKYNWPESGTDYPMNAGDRLTPWNGSELSWNAPENHRKAWQGTVYLPENNSETAERTVMSFPYVILQEGNIIPGDVPKKIRLFDEDKNDGKGLERGMMYDVVALVKNPVQTDSESVEVKISVDDWQRLSLPYEFYGDVELIVDKTVLDLSDQEDGSVIECRSNMPIDFESPLFEYEGLSYPFYKFSGPEGGSSKWQVRVNEEIPLPALKLIIADTDGSHSDDSAYKSYYEHFYVCVGNLRKRIEVAGLELGLQLKISHGEVKINVGDFYGEGLYEGNFDISFSTNSSEGVNLIEVTGMSAEGGAGYEGGLMEGTSGLDRLAGQMVVTLKYIDPSSNEILPPAEAQGKKAGILRIDFNGFNSGDTYWQIPHYYKLIFSAVDGEDSKIQELVIEVVPYKVSYTLKKGS